MLGGRVAFGDQDIAIWQHMQPTWMIEPTRKFIDRQPTGRVRRSTVRPADCRGNVDRRDQTGVWRRQGRACAIPSFQTDHRPFAGTQQKPCRCQRYGDNHYKYCFRHGFPFGREGPAMSVAGPSACKGGSAHLAPMISDDALAVP